MKILLTEKQLKRLVSVSLNESILIENKISIDQIKEKNVGEGKPFSEDEFQQIMMVSKQNPNFVVWLINRIKENIILKEDVYKYEKYFEIFNKYKRQFELKDINQYKTSILVREFINKCHDIMDLEKGQDQSNEKTDGKGKYVNSNGIIRLKEKGIKFLGMSEGYQVFEIPNGLKNDKEAWKVYRNVLGKCGDKDDASISICTIAGFDAFSKYLNDHEGSSYFVLYNEDDRLSPYQLHYESNQFMDRRDQPILPSEM
jgi:hypothetical protein